MFPKPGSVLWRCAWFFSDAVMAQLLNIVDNPHEDVDVRREAVRTCLKCFEDHRKHLYERLAILKADACFATPILAEFIGNRQERYWNGEFAPVGAANLLGAWGDGCVGNSPFTD